jgi:hypothetical protein
MDLAGDAVFAFTCDVRLYGNLIKQLSTRNRIDLVSFLIEDDSDHLQWARDYCASVTVRRDLEKRLTER